MDSPVPLRRWLDDQHSKGEVLTPGQEVIIYELPLAKEYKTRLIDVLNRFRDETRCSLTLRGRCRFEKKRQKLAESSTQEVDKLHQLYLKVIETEESHEVRVQLLRKAEVTVDAFLTHLRYTKDADKIYLFPPKDAQLPPPESTSKTRRWVAKLTDSGDIIGFEAPVAQSRGAPVTESLQALGSSHVTSPVHGQEETETSRDGDFSAPTASFVAEVSAMSQEERLQRAEAARGFLVKTWRSKAKMDGKGSDFRGIISGDCMAGIPALREVGCMRHIDYT